MRLRLILSFVLIVLISVTSVVVIARQSAANQVRAFMYGGGMSNLDALTRSLEDYYKEHKSWQGADSLLSAPGQGMGNGMGMGSGGMMGQRLRLADAQGLVIYDSAGGTGGETLSPSEMSDAIRLHNGLKTAGYLLAEGGMGMDTGQVQFLLNRLTRAALIAGLVAGGISLLVALFLAYSLMRPVRTLTRAASHLAEGDLTERVPSLGKDELGELGLAFNQMADSLQQAEISRRALTADIAHELRNPLAVQRAHLEALQDGIYPLNRDNLAPILDQNLLLTRLVEDLRTLALAEAGQLSLEQVPTDLPSLVLRLIERFQPQAHSQNIDLRFDFKPDPGSPLPALIVDPMRIEQILNNLLSNALRHTPQQGQVVLDLKQAPGAIQLRVHDSGPGIPADALPEIFERFYRAERSRSRSEGGTGLGLAIARQLAQAHGGTLEAANHPDGGAVFTLTLPLK